MKVLAAILILGGSLAVAQSAPPEIQKMNELPNAGNLFLRYCLGPACVTREAICFGQCCDPSEADDMGYACSGDIKGTVPPGFKYVGWTCKTYNPLDKPVYGLKGDAGKKDPCPNRKNPR